MAITRLYGPPAESVGGVAFATGLGTASRDDALRKQQAMQQQQELQMRADLQREQALMNQDTKLQLAAQEEAGRQARMEREYDLQYNLRSDLQLEQANLQLQNYMAKDEMEQAQLKRIKGEYIRDKDAVDRAYQNGQLNQREYGEAMQQLNAMPRYKNVTNLSIPQGTDRTQLEKEFDNETIERNGVLFARNRNDKWDVLFDGSQDTAKLKMQQQQAELKRREAQHNMLMKRQDDLRKQERDIEKSIRKTAQEMISASMADENAEPLNYEIAYARARKQHQAELSTIDMQLQQMDQLMAGIHSGISYGNQQPQDPQQAMVAELEQAIASGDMEAFNRIKAEISGLQAPQPVTGFNPANAAVVPTHEQPLTGLGEYGF